MTDDLHVLISRLPGLEAAKKAIEDQIAEICRRVAMESGGPISPARTPTPAEQEVLGRDSIGRIKRRRNLSEEVKEAKRKLIAQAREARLEKLRNRAKDRVAQPASSDVDRE